VFADIILPLPLDGYFTYSVPPQLEKQVRVGVRVLVPFGRSKTYVGLAARLHDNAPADYKVKDVLRVLDSEPVLLPQQLKLWQWIADYYMSPIGEVYKAALPAGLKDEEGYRPKTETYIRLTPPYRTEEALHAALDMLVRAPKQLAVFNEFLSLSDFLSCLEVSRDELLNASQANVETIKALVTRGLLETYEVEVGRLNHGGDPHPELVKKLTVAQETAYNDILLSMMKHQVTLLHGVTSSGKTEIYIHLIQRELEQHRQVLYLLPEIALTVQMMDRLRRVFGDRLGIYHSKYSDAERVEIWQKQLSAHPYDVILGARSAVFLPFQNLGLVIIDEEHETSYKQQDPAPRYHARSAAIMLAQFFSFLVPRILLGTATPSLESYHNAKNGKYGLVELMERHQGIELPEIQVVDIQDLQRRKMMNGPFSPLLLARVREALERGEQAILFQNRRGYAPMLECRQCGWVPRCQRCDVSLTYHRQLNQLSCHYCGQTYRVPAVCPCCGSASLETRGYGTEKIEAAVRDIFPDARISRMDLDTTRSRQAYERIISDFGSGRTNLLIGTQMISKGLDFDKVSVVGILNADAMINQPDFRAYEHAFMMMAQVSGRAGRRGRRGLVILQTRQPQLPLVRQVVHNDYAGLYHDLCDERLAFRYPPFCRLVYVYVKHRQEHIAEGGAYILGGWLRQWFGARVLGPDKPAVAKVKTLAIRKLIVKLEPGLNMAEVRKYLALAQQQLLQDKRYASLQVYFDVDPL
jgi:primosomal protein N' (replication factor Y)